MLAADHLSPTAPDLRVALNDDPGVRRELVARLGQDPASLVVERRPTQLDWQRHCEERLLSDGDQHQLRRRRLRH